MLRADRIRCPSRASRCLLSLFLLCENAGVASRYLRSVTLASPASLALCDQISHSNLPNLKSLLQHSTAAPKHLTTS
ncbi:hypothetical protein BGZ60DRAFT_402128 [Tricladium varicosporioides]|nr:hypothetical protein BGZ60DRAFT_402128 [Hymenoscyphus varicosporioides]